MTPDRKLKVLAVDDNKIHCYALTKLLASNGFEVTAAHSGGEALEVVRQIHPDAVLLDIGLGDINGFDVCNSIRSDAGLEETAIVFHSASGHAETSPNSGADAFLTYPVDSEH